MTGDNTLILNQDTINSAVEYWLNETQLKAPVTVEKISLGENSNRYGEQLGFIIKIKPRVVDKAE